MRIAQIIGTVTLNRTLPGFANKPLRLALPLSLTELDGTEATRDEPVVVLDEMGAGLGSRILLSEGPEAAQPFWPELRPIDAYNAGILDDVHLSLPKEPDEGTR